MVSNIKLYSRLDHAALEVGFFRVLLPLFSDSLTPEAFVSLKESVFKELGERLDIEYINYIKREIHAK